MKREWKLFEAHELKLLEDRAGKDSYQAIAASLRRSAESVRRKIRLMWLKKRDVWSKREWRGGTIATCGNVLRHYMPEE